MNNFIEIPQESQMLVECLRCALHDQPPSETIKSVDWSLLLRQARGHSVVCFLYPWLCKYLPAQFSIRADIKDDTPQAAWRSIAMEHLKSTLVRQQQATEILAAFDKAGIEVLPLKGTWLSETLYQEASQRQMVDLDLLVKIADRDKASKLLNELGYSAKREMMDSEYMCDLSFYHPAYSIFVELHWNVECQMSGSNEIPDIEKILQRTYDGQLFGKPVKIFKVEDQLCNLVQHILHHQLALSLKSYIDIALLLNKEKLNFTRERIESSASDWKTGNAVPFIIQVVTHLFDLKDIPQELTKTNTDKKILQQAVTAIFELPLASSRNHEINLLKYRDASISEKLKIILSRIFMPQTFMQMHYPFARNKLLLPLAWIQRTIALIRSSGKEVVHTKVTDPNLNNAATRSEIMKAVLKKEQRNS